MRTEDFNYALPESFIAQTPIEPRHNSKLMVLNRGANTIGHKQFWQIGDFLLPGDLLVVNKTRVIPARLFGNKVPGGGKVEVLLLKKKEQRDWVCIVGGSGLNPGRRILFENGPEGEIVEVREGAQRLIRFSQPVEPYLDQIGHVPLPPYIHEKLADPERYQTVYASIPGSAAAPTAGLHFTPELIKGLKEAGIQFADVTLHVGLDTFSPVNEEYAEEHVIHKEWCELTRETADVINQTRKRGGRVIAVGTTSVRTIESSYDVTCERCVNEFSGSTGLYIIPGYKYKVVDAMITNFHLPKSTLLMMISAFTGRDKILDAYEVAKKEGYRFFSFGDAMLIL